MSIYKENWVEIALSRDPPKINFRARWNPQKKVIYPPSADDWATPPYADIKAALGPMFDEHLKEWEKAASEMHAELRAKKR